MKTSDREVRIVVKGDGHTLGNLIAKSALKHPEVEIAAYSIKHPLKGESVIRVVVKKGSDPLKVLKEVLEELIQLNRKLLELVSKVTGIEES